MATLGFTPASGHDVFSIETTEKSSLPSTSILGGKEAREFYEDLMKDKVQKVSSSAISKKDKCREHLIKKRNRGSGRRTNRIRAADMQWGQTDAVPQRAESSGSEANQRRETIISERSMELMGLRLLRCAQEGDISGVKDLLLKGVDINFQVQYLQLGMFPF